MYLVHLFNIHFLFDRYKIKLNSYKKYNLHLILALNSQISYADGAFKYHISLQINK